MHAKLLGAALALAIAGPALAEGMGGMEMPMMGKTAMGEVLTDPHGMTLYTFDKDKGGMSDCYDKCAMNWPPAMAAADAKASGDFGVTERKDGAKQWTHKGMPLYTWAKDKAAGDTTGDGMNGVWHVAKP
ncbi:hypothetical protein V8J36_00395 [Frigidibacter sp. MR17.14]|uniref:COG4315 family predicted lipoprotein n=1 Tax=Frigidibacter sp. MR17.14 TaxID=3126509 RepID=UPI003012D597